MVGGEGGIWGVWGHPIILLSSENSYKFNTINTVN
jgi:hypothetical protein